MKTIVSITSQGQITIPAKLRKSLGLVVPTKAVIEKVGDKIVVEPKKDFWSLGGSLKSKVKLTDKQLREARKKFESDWAKK